MPGKRIKDLTPLSGAGSANNDDVVIFDADADATKRISRSQLAEGMQADVQVFSNKTINLGSNTLTGTTAQFNTALSDNNFATQAGSETLTNKTINARTNTLQGSDGSRLHLFTTVAALLADTGTYTTYAAGQIVEAGGFRYEVAASGATNHHVTTAGGVKLYVQAGDGGYNALAFGPPMNGVSNDATALNTAIRASYGTTLIIPKGVYRIVTPLIIEPIYDGVSQLPITILGDGFDANGGNGGTVLNVIGTINGIELNNATAMNADAQIQIDGLLVNGDSTNASGGDGIYCVGINHLRIKNVWVQGMRNRGIYFERCYGSTVEDSVLTNNRNWGFYANQAWNLGVLRNVRAYANGRAYQSGLCGNIGLVGSGNENLGVVFDQLDISYSGTSAFSMFKRSDSTLTSISVTGGVATVTTASPHGLSTGHLIAVVGARVEPNLNTISQPAVTVTSPTQFTFPTSAGNGTYTEDTLMIGPQAVGLMVLATRGLQANVFCEDCIGNAVYIGSDVRSFEFNGGFWLGLELGCVVVCDSNQTGRFSHMYFTGAYARLQINGGFAGAKNVDVSRSNTFANGALLGLPPVSMRDGNYYSTAAPASGTWSTGDVVWNEAFQGGGMTPGWVCGLNGTPGTWFPMGQSQFVYQNHGDAGTTLTVFSSFTTNFWRSPLTADRTVTLSTTNAFSGAKFRIVRSAGATGAFNLNVGGLKNLAAGQWCDVEYDGSAWLVSAFGSL